MINLKKYRESRGLSQAAVARELGISRQTYNNYELGKRQADYEMLLKLSEFFDTTVERLLADDAAAPVPAPVSNISAVFDDHIRMVPVFESVSAGFGALAENSVVDYLPLRIVSDYEAAETICIRVKGDSMYPKIENGDIIQVHKQESVDSGDIAVVLLDGEEGLVKKVIYGPTWIELHSINPMYPVQRFENEEVLRLKVVGNVKRVIKEL
ncbi:MAG: XRE family transcriptional regulator [Oscillospiraceae bacterium]|nr:XRE family transcriptional regulator [Oscillospiraceae bacterium]